VAEQNGAAAPQCAATSDCLCLGWGVHLHHWQLHPSFFSSSPLQKSPYAYGSGGGAGKALWVSEYGGDGGRERRNRGPLYMY